ncbi:MAG: glycosyltransferase family 2 protein [Chthoniobacterales bacterium]|nr:glycosyltransferase family 2 protein [Chthoniobacterales bacterium]
MTAPAPYLSFCIPTRNRASYLRVLLESIAEQSTPEIEVVISDDASTDETQELVESYRTRLPQLTYERSDPALRYDRNLLHVVDLARGEYCWLFGDDDRLEPGALAEVLQTLRSVPDLTGLTTNRISFDSNLESRLPVRDLKQRTSALYHDANEVFLSLLDRLGFLSCQIVNRTLWKDIVNHENLEPYFTGYVQLYVIARMLVKKPRWQFLAEPCVAFRADNDSFRALGQLGRLQMDVCGYEKTIGDVFGRDTTLYHEAMAEISRTHARHHIVTAKRAGAPFSFFRDALALCVKHYGRYATFWLHTFPVLLMPRSVMLMLRSGYQRLRGHG